MEMDADVVRLAQTKPPRRIFAFGAAQQSQRDGRHVSELWPGTAARRHAMQHRRKQGGSQRTKAQVRCAAADALPRTRGGFRRRIPKAKLILRSFWKSNLTGCTLHGSATPGVFFLHALLPAGLLIARCFFQPSRPLGPACCSWARLPNANQTTDTKFRKEGPGAPVLIEVDVATFLRTPYSVRVSRRDARGCA